MIPKFLTNQYPVEKHLFLIPRFTLNILGVYPETKMTRKILLLACFNLVILSYGNYAEFYYGVYYLKINLFTALDALCPVAASIMSLVKILYIWWHREELKFLIQRVRTLIDEQHSTFKEQVKKNYFPLATRLNSLVLFFGISCSTTYSIRTIVNNIILYMNGKEIIYETPFKMMFPEPFLSMPLYPITFMLVHWHGYVTVLSFAATSGLFLAFCLYFSTLLKALQEDVGTILGDFADKDNKLYDTEEKVCAALEDIINRHNEVVDLTRRFSATMVQITLAQFITSSIIIAFSVFDMLLFSGLSVIVYLAYTGAVFTEIFLYCLGGNTIMETSEEFATKTYCTHWYTHSIKVQKMVLLIIVRSQWTLKVKVPFFSPSFPALTAIIRFTGSVIALAKTII